MTQAIAGVAPTQLAEVTVMTVWPSVSAFAFGRLWGRLMAIEAGFAVFGIPITVGGFFTLASIPFMMGLYLAMRLPSIWPFNPLSFHYRLTNRRIVVEDIFAGELKAVTLDRFDSIEVVVEPGQAVYKAGDLVFRQGATETFRIWGVPRPETFRQTRMKARMSFVGVQQAKAAGQAV